MSKKYTVGPEYDSHDNIYEPRLEDPAKVLCRGLNLSTRGLLLEDLAILQETYTQRIVQLGELRMQLFREMMDYEDEQAEIWCLQRAKGVLARLIAALE